MLKIKITANNRRRYTKKEEIQDLVVDEFQKHKRPLTAKTLVEKGLANHEERARRSFCGILLVLDQSPYYLQLSEANHFGSLDDSIFSTNVSP